MGVKVRLFILETVDGDTSDVCVCECVCTQAHYSSSNMQFTQNKKMLAFVKIMSDW